MNRWGALWLASKPLLPWLLVAAGVIFTAGATGGAVVANKMAQGAIERAKGKVEREKRLCAQDKEAAATAAATALEDEQRKWARLARRERGRAEALRLTLRDNAALFVKEKEELQHALAKTDLRKCDARSIAGRMRRQADRDRREIAAAAARAGRSAGGAGADAGDAGQGP